MGRRIRFPDTYALELSRPSLNADTRVMLDVNASPCRSNISLTCSGKRVGHPGRRFQELARLAAAVVGSHVLNAPLDLSHVVEVVVQTNAIGARPDRRAESRVGSARSNRECSGRRCLSRRRCEQLVEHDARIARHRKRSGRRRPADRVDVDARVTVPAAAGLIHSLDAELQRRNRRGLTKALRMELIERNPRLDPGAVGRRFGCAWVRNTALERK